MLRFLTLDLFCNFTGLKKITTFSFQAVSCRLQCSAPLCSVHWHGWIVLPPIGIREAPGNWLLNFCVAAELAAVLIGG